MSTTILYVEDEDNDVILMRRAFERAGLPRGALHIARDGQAALDWLADAACPLPRLVLLDLHLPGLSGLEVLEHLRQAPRSAALPVVIFSSSGHPADRERARTLGAAHYFTKPTTGAGFLDAARALLALIPP